MLNPTNFIDSCIAMDAELSLIEFMRQYHKESGKETNEAIIEYFVSLVDQEEFIVPASKLREYDAECDLSNVDHRILDGDCYLTPFTFKACLCQANNIYSRYYLFLSEVSTYYSRYLIKRREVSLANAQASIRSALWSLRLFNEPNGYPQRSTSAEVEQDELTRKITLFTKILSDATLDSKIMSQYNFIVMTGEKIDPDKGKMEIVAMIAGQNNHVRKFVREKAMDKECVWNTRLGFTFDGNSIDVRSRIATRLKEFVRQRTSDKNQERVRHAEETNRALSEELRGTQRYMTSAGFMEFSKRKVAAVKIYKSDVPIVWTKQWIGIPPNPVIVADDIVEAIEKIVRADPTIQTQS